MEHTKGKIKYSEPCCNNIDLISKDDGRVVATVMREDGDDLSEREREIGHHLVLCWNTHDTLTKRGYDLDKELRDIRPYAACYRSVCKQLCIESNILGYIYTIENHRDKLLAACTIVQDRLGIICADGGSMQDFLNAGSLAEIVEAKAAIEGK